MTTKKDELSFYFKVFAGIECAVDEACGDLETNPGDILLFNRSCDCFRICVEGSGQLVLATFIFIQLWVHRSTSDFYILLPSSTQADLHPPIICCQGDWVAVSLSSPPKTSKHPPTRQQSPQLTHRTRGMFQLQCLNPRLKPR